MKKAVLYLRTIEQEEPEITYDIEFQDYTCREFAEKNNYCVDKVFVEIGYGANSSNRPKLKEMLKYCKDEHNNIQAIIILSFDKIIRSVNVFFKDICPVLKNNRIELLSATEPLETSTLGRELDSIE